MLNSSNSRLPKGKSSNGVRIDTNQVGEVSGKLASDKGVIFGYGPISNVNFNSPRDSRTTDKGKNVMIGMDVDFVFSNEKEKSPAEDRKDLFCETSQGLEKVVGLVSDVGFQIGLYGPVVLEPVVGLPILQPIKEVAVDLVRDGGPQPKSLIGKGSNIKKILISYKGIGPTLHAKTG